MGVDPEYLVETRLAHLLVVGLTVVGAVGLVTGPTLWFWIGYFLVWLTFVDLFEDDFLSTIFDRGDDSDSERTREQASARTDETVTPLETLKRRYAAGELDDEAFERKLDRLLAIDDLDERQLRELVREQ
jgi:uncharacterized membrane protein